MAEGNGTVREKFSFSEKVKTSKTLKPESLKEATKIHAKAKDQPVRREKVHVNNARWAAIYLCDLQNQPLPLTDVWVTVFLDPHLKLFSDDTSRLLITSGGDVLKQQIYALRSTFKTPLKVGTVLQTAPGDLPCKQAFHVIFKENATAPYYLELKAAFTKCIDLAQGLGAKSIAFSLFTCRAMPQICTVACTSCPGSIKNVLFVSHRPDTVTRISKVLRTYFDHEERDKAEESNMNSLVQGGSYAMTNGPNVQLFNGNILHATTDAMIISTERKLTQRGFAGAIYEIAGTVFQNEFNKLKTKDVTIGSAFAIPRCGLSGDLSCKHVIVAIIPDKETQNRNQMLQKALLSCLKCAEELKTKSLTLPPIGFRYTQLYEQVCPLLVNTLVGYFKDNSSSDIEEVNFVEISTYPYEALKETFDNHADLILLTEDASRSDLKLVEYAETPAEILARGPAALEAYLEASQDGTKPVYRTRLMVVGQERVGKTSLMKNFSGQRFDAEENITDGVDASTLCEVQGTGTKPWKLQDSAKTDLASYVQGQYEDIVCSLMAQTLTAWGEAQNEQRIQDIQEKETVGYDASSHLKEQNIPGEEDDTDADNTQELIHSDENKDGVDSKDQPTEHNTYVREDNLADAILEKVLQELHKNKQEVGQEESTKDAGVQEFQIWDFAGQDVYYTTHQVFLNNRAIYVVAFNLCVDLNKPVKVQVHHDDKVHSRFHDFTGFGFLDFWMQSIYAYATSNQQAPSEDKPQLSPPIFIVGTHRDSSDISHDPEERKRLIDAKFQSITDMIAGKPYEQHVVSKYYAIENSSNDQTDSQLIMLRQHIASVASQEPYMGEKIPLRWLTFEKSVAEAINKGQHSMNLTQVKDVTRNLGIISDTELFTMLHFYHDRGTIIYFGGENNTNTYLQDMVILDPQWLIDIFKRIITVMPHQEQWATMKNKWRRLKEEAILEDRLIDHMWHDLLPQKLALLALMEMFDLLCPRVDAKEGTDAQTYYVPACLQPCSVERAKQTLAISKKSVIFYIDFLGFLPDGLFHRLLVHTARWSQQQSGEEPRLYYRYGNFCLDDEHNFQLEMQATNPVCVKVTVSKTPVLSPDGTGDNSNMKACPEACSMVRIFLENTLQELTITWIHGIKYEFSIACPCKDLHQSAQPGTQPGASLCLHLLHLEECLKMDKIKCSETKKWVETETFKKWFSDGLVKEEKEDSRTLSNEELLDLAEEVGIHWTKLGIRLGLKISHIDALNSDHPMTDEKAFRMLIRWRQGLTTTANARGLLSKALKKCGLVNLAENL